MQRDNLAAFLALIPFLELEFTTPDKLARLQILAARYPNFVAKIVIRAAAVASPAKAAF